MRTKVDSIKVISTSLAILYAISCIAYWEMRKVGEYPMEAIIFNVLFAILFIGSVAVYRKKEWGRVILVATNAVMGIYLFTPYLVLENIVPLGYIFLNIVVFLFFSQGKVRTIIRGKSDKGWRSVLIVDDDESYLKTARHILLEHGYSVLTAKSGEEGFKIAINQRPGLIVLDVILPGIKGREVCKKLKEDIRTKQIPVIFMTIKDSLDDIRAERELGAVAHLTKPFKPTEFLDTIEEIFYPPNERGENWQSILIIDDDSILLEIARHALLEEGYSVLTAVTGEIGWEIIRKQKPDLVILDVLLPGIKGRDLCQKIKDDSETKNIPVVFLTSKDSPDDIAAEKEVGGLAHLTKPIDPKKLLSTVRHILNPRAFRSHRRE